MVDYSCHYKPTISNLGLKWFSMETLRSMEFTVESDIWSFGMLIWEIYTRGQTPFSGTTRKLNWHTLMNMFDNGVRPARPSNMPESKPEVF